MRGTPLHITTLLRQVTGPAAVGSLSPVRLHGVLFRSILLALVSFSLFPSVAAAQLRGAQTLITQPVDEGRLIVLGGNTHPLARVEFDRGAAPSDLPLNSMLLVLQRSPTQRAALQLLLDQQQDRSSPNFHAWLTPEQFGQQFGVVDQDIRAITSWLTSQGFQVNSVSKFLCEGSCSACPCVGFRAKGSGLSPQSRRVLEGYSAAVQRVLQGVALRENDEHIVPFVPETLVRHVNSPFPTSPFLDRPRLFTVWGTLKGGLPRSTTFSTAAPLENLSRISPLEAP